jgi:hypothetical protein
MLEQELEHPVGARLLHASERRGAEQDARAPVTGPAERDSLDHGTTDSERVRAWRSGRAASGIAAASGVRGASEASAACIQFFGADSVAGSISIGTPL